MNRKLLDKANKKAIAHKADPAEALNRRKKQSAGDALRFERRDVKVLYTKPV